MKPYPPLGAHARHGKLADIVLLVVSLLVFGTALAPSSASEAPEKKVARGTMTFAPKSLAFGRVEAGKSSQMYPVWKKQGFTYDASRSGALTWPTRISGFPSMWEFPLQRINIVGYNKTNLSMDYNLLYVQNKAKQTAPAATCAKIQKSTYQSYMQALDAVERTNQA